MAGETAAGLPPIRRTRSRRRHALSALMEPRDSAHRPRLPRLRPQGQSGHGLSLVDVVALVPLLAGTGLLFGGLWQRRQRLDVALTRRPWSARVGAFVAGLGLGLLVASVFAFFWWWAIGAALLTAMLLAAALVAAGRFRPRRG